MSSSLCWVLSPAHCAGEGENYRAGAWLLRYFLAGCRRLRWLLLLARSKDQRIVPGMHIPILLLIRCAADRSGLSVPGPGDTYVRSAGDRDGAIPLLYLLAEVPMQSS